MEKRTAYLVVGLGNPGPAYAETRHNIGFQAADFLAERQRCSFSEQPAFLGWAGSFSLKGTRVVLLKPNTFMNRSGQSLKRALASEPLSLAQVVVIHDDLDLQFGRIKIAFNRGAAGHKGVHDIMETLGARDFIRIKCGIGRPQADEPVIDYVLAPFTSEEKNFLPEMLERIADAVTIIVEEGRTVAMNEINRTI